MPNIHDMLSLSVSRRVKGGGKVTRLRKYNIDRESIIRASLLNNMRDIGLPVDEVDFSFEPFSKTYYGRYFPSVSDDHRPKVRIYPYYSDTGVMYGYDTILYHSIHEMCHHLESTMPFWKRCKGIMHDPLFWKLLNHYTKKAEDRGYLRKELVDGLSFK